MKKSVGILSGLALAIAVATTAGAWYTGKQLPAELERSVARGNEELKKALAGNGGSMTIELVSLDQHFFTSTAHYRLKAENVQVGEAEALNFQITLLIAYVTLFIIGILTLGLGWILIAVPWILSVMVCTQRRAAVTYAERTRSGYSLIQAPPFPQGSAMVKGRRWKPALMTVCPLDSQALRIMSTSGSSEVSLYQEQKPRMPLKPPVSGCDQP